MSISTSTAAGVASPLILGTDMRNMSGETKAIVTNRELIAINQDTLGVQRLKQKATFKAVK